MKLSNPHWCVSNESIEYTYWKFWLPEPPIETVTKFIEILLVKRAWQRLSMFVSKNRRKGY